MMASELGWKEKNKTLEILKAAEAGGYAVVAPVAYTLEHVIACIAAAEKKRSPLILLFFPWAITYGSSPPDNWNSPTSSLLIHTAAHAIARATVPISLHLDHATSPDLIRHAASVLPFDSIMVDMSHHPLEENLRLTEELTSFCHACGVATEAEPGRIDGGEDGVPSPGDMEGVMTTEEQVEQFIATGIDMLAPAFGNVHGDYGPEGPAAVLDFERLSKIRAAVAGRVHLVLHGTNDFTPEITRTCIARGGMSKNNVNKLVLSSYLDNLFQATTTTTSTSSSLSASREGTAEPPPDEEKPRRSLTGLMEQGVEETQRLVEWQMDVCMSTGRA